MDRLSLTCRHLSPLAHVLLALAWAWPSDAQWEPVGSFDGSVNAMLAYGFSEDPQEVAVFAGNLGLLVTETAAGQIIVHDSGTSVDLWSASPDPFDAGAKAIIGGEGSLSRWNGTQLLPSFIVGDPAKIYAPIFPTRGAIFYGEYDPAPFAFQRLVRYDRVTGGGPGLITEGFSVGGCVAADGESFITATSSGDVLEIDDDFTVRPLHNPPLLESLALTTVGFSIDCRLSAAAVLEGGSSAIYSFDVARATEGWQLLGSVPGDILALAVPERDAVVAVGSNPLGSLGLIFEKRAGSKQFFQATIPENTGPLRAVAVSPIPFAFQVEIRAAGEGSLLKRYVLLENVFGDDFESGNLVAWSSAFNF